MWASTSEHRRLRQDSRATAARPQLPSSSSSSPSSARETTTTYDRTFGYDPALKAMLRNKAFTVLQKTYDDSYLSCSTAVYYESQGDEMEAMRHWRTALEQIYEHRAKATPGYGPQTDTEKALVDALRQLELQCKERLDLLEALRASRSEGASPSPGARLSKTPPEPSRPTDRAKGSIGQGTIPAVTYSELSRPSVPNRPSLPARTTSEAGLDASVGARLGPSSSFSDLHRTNSPKLPPRPDKSVRSPSPEKHTMRTTLRSGRLGEKPQRTPRISPKPVAEGPSKAATLAWTALGSKDRAFKPPPGDGVTTGQFPAPRISSDSLARPGQSQSFQWDSHSRRLVTPRDSDQLSNGSQSMSTHRYSDECSHARPSLLSVSAASSALGSSVQEPHPMDQQSSGRPGPSKHPVTTISPRTSQRRHKSSSSGGPEDSGESDKKDASDTRMRGKDIARRPVKTSQSHKINEGYVRRRQQPKNRHTSTSSTSGDELDVTARKARAAECNVVTAQVAPRDPSSDREFGEESPTDTAWKRKKTAVLKNLPPGIDETAAKQILNDIIVHGDEVHWGDIAGLEIAKNALRETVVYPFLRPDLFMGLREPARGMLLFGPPGTGKTMLARAVATESKSTFFSISASSLTSKYLGESEKLVRALFGLARALAPSIIFVDEIDSLLSQRSGSGEHEATRRIKTEFLIQWSDLQRAAAGRETTERDKQRGDANRVLVLAATNLPWAIDEAARRRFVRRQYIPLPEPHTRETQLRTLLGQQKHSLSSADTQELVQLTEGEALMSLAFGGEVVTLTDDQQASPGLTSRLLPRTQPWVRSDHSEKPFCI
ncbi:hypothetical protein JDV02_003682 [Purpureocillium takamizusanense]|uniref:AAA+ ATPase domain-containing protein n=1 Tax=Purpureocillium takamizusanense TaxID=2060973 RepID=A0A9Q8V9Y5_9HYPO|nr:uncharacterized protein JDV02_003682 [Purpureocillium takamizusanense]UNI17329.1 hypothetical protein JDV02_003682 [Purpureocillium takamizusanense]